MMFIDKPTLRKLPERNRSVNSIVLHTTGDANLEKILKFYVSTDGLQPHYVIGLDGTIYRIAPETRVAWHCKIDPLERAFYSQGWATWSYYRWNNGSPVRGPEPFSGYGNWARHWRPALESPLDLITGAHPNYCSIGIELQQPEKPGIDIFTDFQYLSCRGLLVDIATRNRIPLDERHVLGHQDCSPMQRCTAKGPWDPGENFRWSRLI